MSRILVLPGTKWQVRLVKKINELGHEAYVVSPEANPPCKEHASSYFQSDIFDIESIERYAKEEHINAVISDECDIAMPVVAELGERLGLTTLSVAETALYTDKFLMREFCKAHNLNCPDYCLCEKIDEAKSFLQNKGKTIIIKPIDSNSSHGVFTIHNEAELDRDFEEALYFSRSRKAVIAEEYINGTEFTVDGIKTPKGHYTLAISEKKHFEYNRNIAYELFFTHQNKRFDYNLLSKTNDEFVMRSGLRFGFTHAEYKFYDGKYFLIEIAARGGGNQISSLITQYMSGYDTYDYLINYLLGNRKSGKFNVKSNCVNKAAVLHFFQIPGNGGIVHSVEGEDFLQNNESILDYGLNFSNGDRIQDATNDSARIGYYIAGEESEEKLRRLQKEIKNRFKINVR